MALVLPISPSQVGKPFLPIQSNFLSPKPLLGLSTNRKQSHVNKTNKPSLSIHCSSPKLVRDRSLDKHIVKQNRVRFIQKLRTLLLSKPKHFMPIHILSKCRSYLSLSKPRSIISMIQRYPTLFELFYIPYPPTPLNASRTNSQLCVRLTPAAEALSIQEARIKLSSSIELVNKLQKLLMLSPYRRLVLSKLAHLGPALGLPPNFRSRLCNEYPQKFRTVDTSYGRALELVSWNDELANPLPEFRTSARDLIVDRPLKFNLVKLRKGMNVKRRHHDFLVKFGQLPDICPYNTSIKDFPKSSIEAEKRACGVVREILGMTVEKRTLIDHLTHFRKDFGLPNKLRGMLVRHPELFYISLKGDRDSVFLVEAYDDNGELLQKDESLVIKERLFALVRDGKRIRREKRLALVNGDTIGIKNEMKSYDDDDDDEDEDLIDWDDSDFETYVDDSDVEFGMSVGFNGGKKFWTSVNGYNVDGDDGETEFW